MARVVSSTTQLVRLVVLLRLLSCDFLPIPPPRIFLPISSISPTSFVLLLDDDDDDNDDDLLDSGMNPFSLTSFFG